MKPIWPKVVAALITAFWGAMMILLIRSEFGVPNEHRGSVPPSLVWERILTAPDTSTLEIRHGTNRIGYCRWLPGLGQESLTGAHLREGDEPVEGMVKHLAYYTLDVDGTLALRSLPHRLGFDLRLKLDTNRVWREFRLRVTARPDEYELSANAAEQQLRLHASIGGEVIERTLLFSDLRNPQKLLAELGAPALPLILGSLGAPATTNMFDISSAFRWQAHKRSLFLGKNSIPAYRLRATLLGRHDATWYVSPVGEILRVELPDKIVLVNNAVTVLQEQK